jgi:hypothetical protein
MALPLDTLDDWRMAGTGRFHRAGPSTVNVQDGPGILWYPRTEFGDFMLLVDWRLSAAPPGVVLGHYRRPVLHFNVTEHPTSAWTTPQLVDTSLYLFGIAHRSSLSSRGLRPLRISSRRASPTGRGAKTLPPTSFQRLEAVR